MCGSLLVLDRRASVLCVRVGIGLKKNRVSWEDEDNFRMKDTKQVIHWERTIWNLTFQVHGQHMSAFCRHFKFYTNHPDDPKLNYRPSYNIKNPYAPDRYYKGWGNMRNMRFM